MELNILVVDDNIDCLDMIKSFFDLEGIYARYASSGEEAIKMMEESPANLLFTDYNMKCMDGVELSRRVKMILPEIFIVMITGNTSPEITDMAVNAGVSKIFFKPVSLKAVMDVLKQTERLSSCSIS